MSSKDIRDAFYIGSPSHRVYSSNDRKVRLGQLEAMKDFYGKKGNQEEVDRYDAEIQQLMAA